ncbi:neurensin-2 [Alca torda]
MAMPHPRADGREGTRWPGPCNVVAVSQCPRKPAAPHPSLPPPLLPHRRRLGGCGWPDVGPDPASMAAGPCGGCVGSGSSPGRAGPRDAGGGGDVLSSIPFGCPTGMRAAMPLVTPRMWPQPHHPGWVEGGEAVGVPLGAPQSRHGGVHSAPVPRPLPCTLGQGQELAQPHGCCGRGLLWVLLPSPQPILAPLCPPGLMPAREPNCSCGRGPSMAQGKWYGVRSYLHLFYEDCAGASPDGDRDGSSPHGAWAPLIRKVSLSTGTLFLLVGAAALATGSLVPPKLEGIGEEEFVVLDVQAVRYNHALGTCRLVGLALCAAAGALGAIGLLSCALALRRPPEEEQQLSPILRGSTPLQPPAAFTTAGTVVPFGISHVHGVQPRWDT